MPHSTPPVFHFAFYYHSPRLPSNVKAVTAQTAARLLYQFMEKLFSGTRFVSKKTPKNLKGKHVNTEVMESSEYRGLNTILFFANRLTAHSVVKAAVTPRSISIATFVMTVEVPKILGDESVDDLNE